MLGTTTKLILFICTLACLVLILREVQKKVGFVALYYAVAGATALMAIWIFSVSAGNSLENFPMLGFTLASLMISLPPILFVLSIVRSSVTLLVRVPCLVASFLFSLWMLVALALAGGGIIG